MTVTEEFISVEKSQEFGAAAPTYPTAFGITLTPAVSGALIAFLGLAGGLYLLLNLVMPSLEKYQELEASQKDKQGIVEQKQGGLRQSEKVQNDLAQAKQQKAQVLALFANEKTLDTLLMDLNRVVESGNAKLQRNYVRAKLKRFVPVNQSADVIADNSLGSEVNGKLKRRVINVEVEGTFEQTQLILRNIERLQPLLIVRDYQSTLSPASPSDPQGRVVRGPATITTSFQLQALMPINPEDAPKSAESANQPQK